MADIWLIYQEALTVFMGALALIALSNLWAMRRVDEYSPPPRFPRVSILIPARNEERSIGICVRSLLAQEYPDFEVLVMDDHSTDRTGAILAGLAAEDERLRLIPATPLPEGWFGKHWACHQLAEAATGELLLFIDADTLHHPRSLHDAVGALLAEKADLLTLLPQEIMGSWAERLVVPTLPWSIHTLLPLAIAHRVRLPALSSASGQFMLFRRAAYEQVGGYAAVRDQVLDDISLGKAIKAHGLRWRMGNGVRRICCRMYHNAREVFEGFGKNQFANFDYRLLPYVVSWVWLALAFWEPLLVVALGLGGVALPGLMLPLAVFAVLCALFVWSVAYWRFNIPQGLVLLYPVSILLQVVIAARSMVLAFTGEATWKGRKLERKKIRLF